MRGILPPAAARVSIAASTAAPISTAVAPFSKESTSAVKRQRIQDHSSVHDDRVILNVSRFPRAFTIVVDDFKSCKDPDASALALFSQPWGATIETFVRDRSVTHTRTVAKDVIALLQDAHVVIVADGAKDHAACLRAVQRFLDKQG
ncbi:hypothetical protein H257_06880 [Aphanomyces astaci]|uniref:Uncharacterized protein n=1 Tax=Aphanomyces astaci TaxID=112090 RepID=W4GIV4_APHAT|nr:hypothetical protein H257_06880 [Aphanomyces astaci]ETV79620.1 hypothetical protein H257_06880 [Aphanomyces astaci]|eukprot:XP_009830556.1 hypothetical protein H257_06880 [Aphanomyces astaci]